LDVVDVRREQCAATLPVDSPTDEDILANGRGVSGAAADASWFSPLKSA
jgi:hypothetical protein